MLDGGAEVDKNRSSGYTVTTGAIAFQPYVCSKVARFGISE